MKMLGSPRRKDFALGHRNGTGSIPPTHSLALATTDVSCSLSEIAQGVRANIIARIPLNYTVVPGRMADTDNSIVPTVSVCLLARVAQARRSIESLGGPCCSPVGLVAMVWAEGSSRCRRSEVVALGLLTTSVGRKVAHGQGTYGGSIGT